MLLGKLLRASSVSESLTAVSNVVLPEKCVKVREAEGMRCAEDNQSVRNLYLAPSLSPRISHYCPLELLSSSSIPPLPLERCRLQLIEQIATKMKKKTLRKVAVVTREKLEMYIDCSLECKCLASPRSPPSFARAKWRKKFDNRPEEAGDHVISITSSLNSRAALSQIQFLMSIVIWLVPILSTIVWGREATSQPKLNIN